MISIWIIQTLLFDGKSEKTHTQLIARVTTTCITGYIHKQYALKSRLSSQFCCLECLLSNIITVPPNHSNAMFLLSCTAQLSFILSIWGP